MFVGHYGVGLAAKRVDARLPLGWLFLAVQFPDIVWGVLLLLGVEKARIVPGFMDASDLDLFYHPYSHGLLTTLLWAAAAFALVRLLPARDGTGARRRVVAAVMAAAILSHFLLDVLVHSPDLPLYGDRAKIGLGLWRNAGVAYAIEGLILVGGLILYLRATTAATAVGRYGMVALVAFMLAFNASVLFGPPPADLRLVAAGPLAAYALFAALAVWLDGKRPPAATAGSTTGRTFAS